MLRLTNKQTGHTFNLSPKEAADFFYTKNARKEFINPSEKYVIQNISNEVSTFKFWLCSIALMALFMGSILLHVQLNY